MIQWADLNQEERELALLCLSEIDQHGESKTLNGLTKLDWEIEPPTIHEFLENDYYVGGRATEMYPLLKKDMTEIFESDHIEEVILTGAIGWGKSWVSSFGLAYDLLTLLCLRTPQQFYGIAGSSDIVMMNLSVTGDNASSVLWAYVFNLFREMPWAKDHFPNHDWKKLGLGFHSKRVFFRSGSSSEFAAIGQNVIGGAMDEANFMIGAKRSRRAVKAGESDQAKVLYDQLSRRRKSRFLQKDGRLPGHFWLISSKQFPGDFLERRIDEAKDNPTVKVIDYDQWTPKKSLPGGGPYSGKNFALFIGTAEHRSRILVEDATTFDENKIEIPPQCKIKLVPIEYLREFKEDLYGSIKDVAGHSIQAINPFFDRPDALDKCVLLPEFDLPGRQHPYEFETSYVIDPKMIKWGLIPSMLDKKSKMVMSALHPGSKRFAHIDLSETGDATGCAIGHYGGHKDVKFMVEVPDPTTGGTRFIEVEESRPVTVIDFMMKFVPPIGGRIDLAAVRYLLMALAQALNWQWEEVTYDQYQSAESIQAWSAEGIKCYKFSVDRTSQPYELFRSSMYQERFSCYEYRPLKQDIASLDWIPEKQKVDHRPGGTKDVSDCCAAVVEHVERCHPAVPLVINPTWGLMTTGLPMDQREKQQFMREVQPGLKSIEKVIEEMNYDPWEKAERTEEWDPLGNIEDDHDDE